MPRTASALFPSLPGVSDAEACGLRNITYRLSVCGCEAVVTSRVACTRTPRRVPKRKWGRERANAPAPWLAVYLKGYPP